MTVTELNQASLLAGFDDKEDPKIKRLRDKRTAELKDKLVGEQLSRYEVYRSAGFNKNLVKRTMQTAGATAALAETSAVVLAGITKVFVGEVVELGNRRSLLVFNSQPTNSQNQTAHTAARSIEDEWGDSGALQPKHVREAYRRLRAHGALPYAPVQPLMRRRRRC